MMSSPIQARTSVTGASLLAGRRGIALAALAAVSVLVTSSAGRIVSAPSVAGWCRTIQNPSLNPPNCALPVAWSLLFILMGVAFWRVLRTHRLRHCDVLPSRSSWGSSSSTSVGHSPSSAHVHRIGTLGHRSALAPHSGPRDDVSPNRQDRGAAPRALSARTFSLTLAQRGFPRRREDRKRPPSEHRLGGDLFGRRPASACDSAVIAAEIVLGSLLGADVGHRGSPLFFSHRPPRGTNGHEATFAPSYLARVWSAAPQAPIHRGLLVLFFVRLYVGHDGADWRRVERRRRHRLIRGRWRHAGGRSLRCLDG